MVTAILGSPASNLQAEGHVWAGRWVVLTQCSPAVNHKPLPPGRAKLPQQPPAPRPGLKVQCPRKPQVSLLQPLVSRVSDQEAGPCVQSCPPHPSPPWEEAIGPRCAQRPTLLEKRVDATDTVSDHKLETRP